MPLEPLSLSGLSSLKADELVPLDSALDATNCYVDDGTIRGRNGYRSVSGGNVGSNTVQGLWRFRPTSSSARSIAVQGAHVWKVTDPSTETASDGAGTDLGAITGWSSSSLISGTQLGQYFYLGSDDAAAIWKRITPAFALDALTSIAQPAVPTVSNGTLSVILFDTLAAPTLSAGMAISAYTNHLANLTGVTGETAIFNFGADKDWSSTNWLLVICSPETTSGGGGTFQVELATAAGSWETIATIADTSGAEGSPACVFCSLRGLTSATRAAARRIRFTNLGPTGDPFTVSGVMPIPSAPSPGPVDYYITYYNSSTAIESVLSPVSTVQYNSDGITFPQANMAQWYYNAYHDLGLKSTDPLQLGTLTWNASGGGASPSPSEFAAVKTFSLACPAGTYDTVRLWRLTPTGIRLVKSQTVTPGVTTYSITDDTGDATLSHQLYKAGGTPPPCVAMAAVNQRIVCGGDPSNPNRLYISSYVAPNGAPSLYGASGDPWPQFPAVPLIASDGWAFDISPTSAEQILWIGNGDRAAYIGTNEAMYVMTSLDPNSPPFKVFERGVIGRRAACWAESALFWAAHDGIYMARNRSEVDELTKDIRRLYRATFAPDSTTVLLYQDRKLYAVKGTSMLRYDFVTQTWTKHTLGHTMSHGDDWRDPSGTYQHMWFQSSTGNLYRWQPGTSPSDSNRATSDGGTSIADWTYSSGFSLKSTFQPGTGYGEAKTRIRSVFLDASGAATVSLYKDATTSPVRSKATTSGEHQLPFASDLTAYKWRLALTAVNTIQVKRALWERQAVAGEGG